MVFFRFSSQTLCVQLVNRLKKKTENGIFDDLTDEHQSRTTTQREKNRKYDIIRNNYTNGCSKLIHTMEI